jgi:glycosyltransferase involved in cell wall biosynthesis
MSVAASRSPGSSLPPSKGARISLFMQDFGGGGAEKIMLLLAAGLASRQHDVEIVVVRDVGPYLEQVPVTVRVVTLGTRRVSRSIPALARYIRDRRPHAGLSSQVHMNVAMVLARAVARVPMRLALREENRIGQNRRADRLPLVRVAYMVLPWAYVRADHVIAVSRGLADEVKSITGLSDKEVSAVYNPVMTAETFGQLMEKGTPPHLWLRDLTIPVVLAVGRLVPEKDYEILLQAFSRLRVERLARLVILGTGSLHGDLLRQAQGLGIDRDVLFAGFADDPFAWMQHASVLAHTARWEGFGNVIAEALACGLPVVATDCPSGPFEILEGGRYGKLVPVGDAGAVARALSEMLDASPDPATLRRRAAEFTVEAILPRYEEILLAGIHGDV